jgi:hypothetical protein
MMEMSMASAETQKTLAPASRSTFIPTVLSEQPIGTDPLTLLRESVAWQPIDKDHPYLWRLAGMDHPMLLGESVKKTPLFLGPLSGIREKLELFSLRRLGETTPISHNKYPGQDNELQLLASCTKFTSVARSAFSLLSGDAWIVNAGIANPYDNIVKFTIDFLKEGGKYESIERIAVGVAKEKTAKAYFRQYRFEDALVSATSPMDPLAKYAIDVLNESKPELVKEFICDVEKYGSFTTARYAIELLLRDGKKAEIMDAEERLSKWYELLTDRSTIHPILFDFSIVCREAFDETVFFLRRLSKSGSLATA